MADNDHPKIEEHELPSVEALLACTLALMTGYSQALQAEVHPAKRLAMGEKIAGHLEGLVGHPLLSTGFSQVLLGLHGRWLAMGDCTRDASGDVGDAADGDPPRGRHLPSGTDDEAQHRRPRAEWLH